MQVKATKLGYYDLKRKKEGEVFVLKDPKAFSPKWMENLDEVQEEAPAPKRGRPFSKQPESKSSSDIDVI